MRRWLVNAIECRGKGLSAEHTGTQQVAFSSHTEEKAKLCHKARISKIWSKNQSGGAAAVLENVLHVNGHCSVSSDFFFLLQLEVEFLTY